MSSNLENVIYGNPAKLGAFSFSLPNFNTGFQMPGNMSYDYGNFFNDEDHETGHSGGLDELSEISRCIALGLPYPCSGSSNNQPVYLPPNTTTQPPRNPQPSNTGNSSGDSGLSWLDKVLGLTGLVINRFGNNQNVPMTPSGQVLTTGTNPGAANTLSQVGANVGAGAGGFLQSVTRFASDNPLLVAGVVIGGALYLMPSPRSRNGILKIIPNPKRRRRSRRRK